MASTSQTCSICQTSAPKYRCPRCPQVRTCSLPCYKRHQQRATCDGQRSATNFLKKSIVTTPSVIDHDYNFLTNIERALDKDPDDSGRPWKRRKYDHALDNYCAENNITIALAPDGFSRSNTNKSRMLPNAKKVRWTVEWIAEDGASRVSDALEDVTLEEAWQLEERKQKKAQRDAHIDGLSSTNVQTAKEERRLATSPAPDQESADSAPDAPDHDRDTTAGDTASPPLQAQAATAQQCHFYLHVPQQQSKSKMLAPLLPDQTLASALRGRTLLEFPTIYRLQQSPSTLQASAFVLAPPLPDSPTTIGTAAAPATAADLPNDPGDVSALPNDERRSNLDSDNSRPSRPLQSNSDNHSNELSPGGSVDGNAPAARHDTRPADGQRRGPYRGRGGGEGRGRGRGQGRGEWHSRGRGRGPSSFHESRGGGAGRGVSGGRGGWRGGSGAADRDAQDKLAREAAAAAAADKRRILELLRRD